MKTRFLFYSILFLMLLNINIAMSQKCDFRVDSLIEKTIERARDNAKKTVLVIEAGENDISFSGIYIDANNNETIIIHRNTPCICIEITEDSESYLKILDNIYSTMLCVNIIDVENKKVCEQITHINNNENKIYNIGEIKNGKYRLEVISFNKKEIELKNEIILTKRLFK